ncbi:MAG: hypothetical protein ABJG26_11545, partial [Marinomonas sp.]
MQSRSRTNPLKSGAQLFTQGCFWPIGLVAMDEFEATLLVPDSLELAQRERVTLKLGELPSFPAIVRSLSGDVVQLQFLGAVHPTVIALLETGEVSLS